MQGKPLIILMADDDEDDRLNTAEAFREHHLANDFHTVNDGEELMQFLRRKGKYADAPRPGLILLDLNRPRGAARDQERPRAALHSGGDPHHLARGRRHLAHL
jgi:two-component system response regulator